MKGELFFNRINLTKTFCVYQSVTVCAHAKHRFKENNQCTVEKKNAVFRVKTEVTEDLVKVR